MEQSNKKKSQARFQRQPIICPWIPSQPYPSTQGSKNKLSENTRNKAFQHKMWTKANSTEDTKFLNTAQSTTSTSHFFYFLRLMQLFPDTHPATLHTVLTLTKNNFFSAIDKLLYARKCKSAYYKSHCYYKISSKFQNSNNTHFHHHGKNFQMQNVQVQNVQQEYTAHIAQNTADQQEDTQIEQQQDQMDQQQVTVIGIERNADSDDEEFKDHNTKTEIIQIRIENNEEEVEMEQGTILNHNSQEINNEGEDQLLSDVNDIITNSSEIIECSDDVTLPLNNPKEEADHRSHNNVESNHQDVVTLSVEDIEAATYNN